MVLYLWVSSHVPSFSFSPYRVHMNVLIHPCYVTVICKFILETSATQGEHYTPRSLGMLLAGLHRHVN